MSSPSRPNPVSSPEPPLPEPVSTARSAQKLAHNDDYLKAVLATVIDAVVAIDSRGIIVDANPATERIFGYTNSELVGQNVSMLMPSPYREKHDEYLARYQRTGQANIIGIGREVMALRKDGGTFPVDLAVSEIDHLGLFTGTIRDISERKRLEREILETAAEEQRRIGQDLHDGVGQELTGIGLFAQTLAETLQQQNDPAAELAAKIVASVERVQNQVRGISRGLVPVSIEAGGLPAALQQLAEDINATSRSRCTVDCEEPCPPLALDVANHLYRIAQEAAANALRHGQANHVEISLSCQPQNVVLAVEDDGQGMPPQPADGTGLGLRSMNYRAHLIGGLLSVEPRDGGGTRVACLLPREIES